MQSDTGRITADAAAGGVNKAGTANSRTWASIRSGRVLPVLPVLLFVVVIASYVLTAGERAAPTDDSPAAALLDSGGKKPDSVRDNAEREATVGQMLLRRADSTWKPVRIRCDTIIGDTTGRAINREMVLYVKDGSPDATFLGHDSSFVLIGGDTCIYTELSLGVTTGVPDTIRIYNRCTGETASGCVGYIGDSDWIYHSLCDSLALHMGYGLETNIIEDSTEGGIGTKKVLLFELKDTTVVPVTFSIYDNRWDWDGSFFTYPDSTAGPVAWMKLHYYANTWQDGFPAGKVFRVQRIAWTMYHNSMNPATHVLGGMAYVNGSATSALQDKALFIKWVRDDPSRTPTGPTEISLWVSDLYRGPRANSYMSHIHDVTLDDGDFSSAIVGTNNVLLTVTVWIQVFDDI